MAALATLVTACAHAQAVPAGFWEARLWLTGPAFGLKEDCPVRVLFQDPRFRSAALPDGGLATSKLTSVSVQGDDVLLVVDTTRDSRPVERVILRARPHAEHVVSVESITLAGPGGVPQRTLSYADAVDDDEDYDLYTDTLVSLYTTWFDPATIRERLAKAGAGGVSGGGDAPR